MRGLYFNKTPDTDDAVGVIAIIILLMGLIWLFVMKGSAHDTDPRGDPPQEFIEDYQPDLQN